MKCLWMQILVRVSGDSMEPLPFERPDYLGASAENTEDGEIGIFFLDGEAYVKNIIRLLTASH